MFYLEKGHFDYWVDRTIIVQWRLSKYGSTFNICTCNMLNRIVLFFYEREFINISSLQRNSHLSQFLRAPIFLYLRDKLWLKFGYVFKAICGVWNLESESMRYEEWLAFPRQPVRSGNRAWETEGSFQPEQIDGHRWARLSNPGLSLRAEASFGCRDSKLPKL